MMKKLSRSLMLLKFQWDKKWTKATVFKSKDFQRDVSSSSTSESLSLSTWSREWMLLLQILPLLSVKLLAPSWFLMLVAWLISQNIQLLQFRFWVLKKLSSELSRQKVRLQSTVWYSTQLLLDEQIKRTKVEFQDISQTSAPLLQESTASPKLQLPNLEKASKTKWKRDLNFYQAVPNLERTRK